jgi:phosphonate transport system ATP-binding protein
MRDQREELAVAADTAVSVRELRVSRDARVLFDRMTWDLPRGSFLAVTGPSGVGKSSLLSCLRGTLPADAGDLFVAPESRSIGVVFQHLRLSGNLSVLTNVLCGRLGRYPWWKTLFSFGVGDRHAAYTIITDLGLAGLCHKPVRMISGGEQQRAAVARVLFQGPELILADEPTSDLDLVLADQVLSKLRLLCKENGTTIICVMHSSEMVERFADHELCISPYDTNGWAYREVASS